MLCEGDHTLTYIDLPVQELYKSVVIPDIVQLELGVMFDKCPYIGTIHFLCGDHNELCGVAGILGIFQFQFCNYRTSSTCSQAQTTSCLVGTRT